MASLKETLTALADAIRKKTGKTEKMTLAEMPAEVAALPSGGRDDEFISGEFKDGNYENDSVTKLRDYAFYQTSLSSASFPNVTSIGENTFGMCQNLTSVSLPNVAEIKGSNAFYNCIKLTSVKLSSNISIVGTNTFSGCPIQYFNFKNLLYASSSAFSRTKLTEINAPELKFVDFSCFSGITTLKKATFEKASYVSYSAFSTCESLAIVILPNVTSISPGAFDNTALNILVIGTQNTTKICMLNSSDAFDSTPIAKGAGYIYVPDALVDQYKAATNWSVFANQIKGLSEKPAE